MLVLLAALYMRSRRIGDGCRVSGGSMTAQRVGRPLIILRTLRDDGGSCWTVFDSRRAYRGPWHLSAWFWFRRKGAPLYTRSSRCCNGVRAGLHRTQEGGNFSIRKRAMVSRSERFESKISDGDAFHFFNRMASLEQTSAQDIGARFGKRDFIPRCIFAFYADDMRTSRAGEAFNLFEGEQGFQFQIVGLLEVVRFEHQIRQVAVVSQKNEAHGVIFEASHGENALGDSMEQIAESAAPFGIAHSGNYFRRLVQEKINSLFFRAKEPPVDFDVVARLVRLRAHLGHGASVDRHHSR